MYCIPLMRNTFYREEETKERLCSFITDASQLSMGDKCFEFERKFSEWQGCEDSTLVNSGSSANLILLQALKNIGLLRDGDHIGFSALTWSTNVMPIIQLGMIPIPIDVSPETLNVDIYNLERAIANSRIKCLFLTNALGFCDDLLGITKLCSSNNILFIEDNCESLGTRYKGIRTGNYGIASTFSFFVGHHMSTIEGGMVCSNNKPLTDMLKIVRANGWDRQLDKRDQDFLRQGCGEFSAKYRFYDLAYNVRPTEIMGFLGLEQLRYLDEIIAIRHKQYRQLSNTMIRNKDFRILDTGALNPISAFAIPIICQDPTLRKKYLERFEEESVETRPIIAGNIQNQPFWSKYVPYRVHLPWTDTVEQCGFYIGNYPGMTDNELNIIEDVLCE